MPVAKHWLSGGRTTRRANAELGLAVACMVSERNTAGGRLSSCPQERALIRQCEVAVLDKGAGE